MSLVPGCSADLMSGRNLRKRPESFCSARLRSIQKVIRWPMDFTVEEFFAVAGQFQLGGLDTESQHPLTLHLSEQAQQDLPAALAALKAVDVLALERFVEKAAGLPALAEAIQRTLRDGKRLFFCGCGATGRLSLSLEWFCRCGLLPAGMEDRVISFMAGGDMALIKAIEKFEDHPEYGARQLEELGFAEGDLLLATTEGGETPWVIGATERAAELSTNPPWFLYCNPDEELIAAAERSRRVLANEKIRKLNLAVGPMALAGSTRMQASTVLMAALGFAVQHREQPASAWSEARRFLERVRDMDLSWLAPFTAAEAKIYQDGGYVLYDPAVFGITVLTDTTERSPTFMLRPFENQLKSDEPASWCHLYMPEIADGQSAWTAILKRAPRTLEWDGVREIAGAEALAGYDFSATLLEKRLARTGGAPVHLFVIRKTPTGLSFSLDDLHHTMEMPGASFVTQNLLLKLILNTHSTLVMGRLGRYLDNLMTYVKPSNLKLIDRAIRYVRLLMQRRNGTCPDYATVARQLFLEQARLGSEEPIVMKTMLALAAKGG